MVKAVSSLLDATHLVRVSTGSPICVFHFDKNFQVIIGRVVVAVDAICIAIVQTWKGIVLGIRVVHVPNR